MNWNNIRKNARLTPQGRLLFVERITEAAWSVVQTAQAGGISVRQSYRWHIQPTSSGHRPRSNSVKKASAVPAKENELYRLPVNHRAGVVLR